MVASEYTSHCATSHTHAHKKALAGEHRNTHTDVVAGEHRKRNPGRYFWTAWSGTLVSTIASRLSLRWVGVVGQPPHHPGPPSQEAAAVSAAVPTSPDEAQEGVCGCGLYTGACPVTAWYRPAGMWNKGFRQSATATITSDRSRTRHNWRHTFMKK